MATSFGKTTHLQNELKVTWPHACSLQIPEYHLSGIRVWNTAECRETVAPMINEAGATKVIAATLKSARVDKGANTEKFYLHNSLLPCKEQQSSSLQEGGFYHTIAGTFKTAIVFKSVTLSEKKMCSLNNILGSNSPQCKARAALLTLLKVME